MLLKAYNMEKLLLLFVTLLVSFSSCTNNHSSKNSASSELKEVELKRLYTYKIGATEDTFIGRLRTDFQSNYTANTFAFYDETLNQFVFTDTLGNIKTMFGSEGRGPKEFVKVSAFNFTNGDNFYVYDIAQFMVKVFDRKGEYLYSFVLEPKEVSTTGRFMVPVDGKLYFPVIETRYLADIFKADNSVQLAEFDTTGKMSRSFGRYDSLTSKSNSYTIFPYIRYSQEENSIYTVQINSFIVQGWDVKTGQRVYSTNQKPPHFNMGTERISPYLPISEIRKKSAGLSFSSNLFSAKDFKVLHYENSTEAWQQSGNHDDKEQYLAFYDKYGELVAEKRLVYRPANVVNNRLHLILNDDPDNYEIGVYDFYVE